MKFIADEMLGKLARWLRMAGYDVAYHREILDSALLEIADEENRLILTRDTRLIRGLPAESFLFITEDHLPQQLEEFFARFPSLKTEGSPLSRCVECNTPLQSIPKETIQEKVWPYVYQTQEHFTTCPTCHRIYWEATHVQRIKEKLGKLIG